MSKATHFSVKSLKAQFNTAMKSGNIELAKKIDAQINEKLGLKF